MLSRLRSKLNYSNAVATIALFIALSGVAVAAGLPKNSVGPKQLKRGAVSTVKLRKEAVTSAKLARKSVIAAKLAPNSVGPGALGNGAVTSAKLAAGSVIAASIKNGVVTSNKLATGAVTTTKLADGSVTTAKLGSEVGPLLGTLRSGQTLRGVFDLGDEGKLTRSSDSFPFALANAPTAPTANVLLPGANSAACPGNTGGGGGTPQAAPGQLCLYITSSSVEFESLDFDPGSVSRFGFGLLAKFKGGTDNFVQGRWAVTAP